MGRRGAPLRRVGIPVRVSIASPKALAKFASEIAKKSSIFAGVLDMIDETLADWLLTPVPVSDIWGIGRQIQKKLHTLGIVTAAELRDMPLRQARQVGTFVLERAVLELQGEPCPSSLHGFHEAVMDGSTQPLHLPKRLSANRTVARPTLHEGLLSPAAGLTRRSVRLSIL